MSTPAPERAWPLSALLAAGATGLVLGLALGFGAGRLTASPAAPVAPVAAAPVTPAVTPPVIPPSAAPVEPVAPAEPAAAASTAAIALPALPGSTLTLTDLAFTLSPPTAPKDRMSLADGVLTVSAVPGATGVVAACLTKRIPVAGQLGVKLEWRRVDVPAGNAEAFGRVIVRAFGADGKVAKKGYLALARAQGPADWKAVGSVLTMPEGATTAAFCSEISGPAGRVEVRGLELSGVPATGG